MDNKDWSRLNVVVVGNAPLSSKERTKIESYDVVVRLNNMRNWIPGEKTTILCTKSELWSQVKSKISNETIVWTLKYKGLPSELRSHIGSKCEVIKRASGSSFKTHNSIYPKPEYSKNKAGYRSSLGFRIFFYILQKKPQKVDYLGFTWTCGDCLASAKNNHRCCNGHHWRFEHDFMKNVKY